MSLRWRMSKSDLRAENGRLLHELADLNGVLSRVIANESNHYDRYWQPAPGRLTAEWLDESEAKWREGLEDVFCDDAAAVFLEIAQEVRRCWAEVAASREAIDVLHGDLFGALTENDRLTRQVNAVVTLMATHPRSVETADLSDALSPVRISGGAPWA